jgi:N-glycosidase YbiA
MPITFTKVDLPHGWLGNMAPFPVKYDGKWWLTTEALFQALRFDDAAIREELRTIKSPMGVKMRAKREKAKMVVERLSEQDLANIEIVLRLKLEQHRELKQKLLETGDETIIEDCSNRPGGSGKFWGAALKDGQWVGDNMLGKMWMKLRGELKPK